MEAVGQINSWNFDMDIEPVFTFRNVNVSSALAVHEQAQDIELFTMMYPQKLSTASTSDIWYDFSISSFEKNQSVSHCIGSISVKVPLNTASGTQVDAQDYDKWSMGRWYTKLAEEGLCFGPAFQTLTSMKTDKARVKPQALSTTRLFQRVPRSTKYHGTPYAIHPLVVDACLQAAIMGGTAGEVQRLKAFLPTFIGDLQIKTPHPDRLNSEVFIHSQSQTTGFSMKKISVTLRDGLGETLIDMSNTKLSLYVGKVEEEVEASEANRHPTLRVVWKPDITRLEPGQRTQLGSYLEDYVSTHHNLFESTTLGIMAGLVDLAGHKNPRLRVLELSRDCDCRSKQFLDILDNKSDFPRSRKWLFGSLANGELAVSSVNNPDKSDKIKLDADHSSTYDMVILAKVSQLQDT